MVYLNLFSILTPTKKKKVVKKKKTTIPSNDLSGIDISKIPTTCNDKDCKCHYIPGVPITRTGYANLDYIGYSNSTSVVGLAGISTPVKTPPIPKSTVPKNEWNDPF